MAILLRWTPPDDGFGWTHTRLYRDTSSTGSFPELTSGDISGYTASGIPIATTTVRDNNGTTSHYYRIRFYDSVAAIYSDYSDVFQPTYARGYCTIEDVRRLTNIQSTEYDDGALEALIDGVTREVDRLTGRTWQGVQTVTDQYLDGTGINVLTLPHTDIGSVTALALDDDDDGTYTTVSITYIQTYADDGFIALHRNANIHIFPDHRKAVKITYTWGNATPTADVTELAMLLVANTLKVEETRTGRIRMLLAELSRARYDTV